MIQGEKWNPTERGLMLKGKAIMLEDSKLAVLYVV